jgi:hypothetical protein
MSTYHFKPFITYGTKENNALYRTDNAVEPKLNRRKFLIGIAVGYKKHLSDFKGPH